MSKSFVYTLGYISSFIFVSFFGGSFANALCTRGSFVYLRKGPGTGFSKTWMVGMYTPLVREEKKGRWYEVSDQEGKRHWVSSSLVTRQFRCLSIRLNRAQMRTGPGNKYSRAEFRTADKYSAFKILRQKGSWYEVLDDWNQRSWVHRKFVWLPVKTIKINY